MAEGDKAGSREPDEARDLIFKKELVPRTCAPSPVR